MAHGANRLLTVEPRLMDRFVRRFWSKVRFRTSFDECWEWQAAVGCDFGYGEIGFPAGTQGPLRSHCASYVLAHGPIPGGMWVLHKCGNAPCVNPKHLYAGRPHHNSEDTAWDAADREYRQMVKPVGLMMGLPDRHDWDDDEASAVVHVLRTLRPVERFVIESRFGLSGQEPLTLEQCGKKMKRTRERVRQLEERSIRKMRERIESLNLL